MKKVLAFSAMIALFTGCTELNLPKPQTNTSNVSNNVNKYAECEKLYPPENDDKVKNNYLNRYECEVKFSDAEWQERVRETQKIGDRLYK